MDYIRCIDSPVGGLLLSSDGAALTGLWIEGQKYYAAGLGAEREEKNLPVFGDTERWLAVYFSGAAPDFTPELNPRGSAFRLAVWKILRGIPYGKTTTYGKIAAMLNAPETCPYRVSRPPYQPASPSDLRAAEQKVSAIPAGQKNSSASVLARAVGGAVGHNPVSLIIPCHRVLGADGSLTGYAGGLDTKAKLLRLEAKGRTAV
jgi:methylated-DNA-[protein]-cysteine S-methyltransferase